MTQELDAVIVEAKGKHNASIIWLHGLGADGHDFEPIVPELSKTLELGVKFIFPNAPIRPITMNGGMAMRGWYDIKAPDLRHLEDEGAIRKSAEMIEAFIAAEKANGIPTEKIIIAGFSQGGAITYQVGLRYPEKLAGLLALSTYLPLASTLEAEANKVQLDTPIMIAHGTFDPIIPIEQAEQSRKQLQDAGYSISWHEYPIPHSVSPKEIQDIDKWLAGRLK